MKKIVFLAFAFFFVTATYSQDMAKFKLYHPEANAKEEIAGAVKEAKQTNKHVLIQIGGNWCIWCARFHEFVTNDKSLDSLVKANYVVYHLNFSKENENKDILAQYKFPQRFGFPVFLILDSDGNLLHTQNSAYLESGKGYDREKVKGFFADWTKKALDVKQY